MARKKDEEPKDEPLDAEEGAADEAPGDDELLPSAPAAAARGGGSGVFIAIVVVFAVIVLAVVAYVVRKNRDEAEKERLVQRKQVLGTQLSAVKANVEQATRRIDESPPNIDGAIEALNTAASQLAELALTPSADEAGLSDELTDLKRQLSASSEALVAQNSEYQEAVSAAERELKTSSLGEIRPLAGKLDTLITGAYGDVDTPLMVPGVSSVGTKDEAPEPPAETKTESP